MPRVPDHDMARLYPHAPRTIADGWHVAWGNRGPMLRRDDDYARYGQYAQLWEVFDVTRQPSVTYSVGGTVTTTTTGELVCHIVHEHTGNGERFRYRLPNGYVSRLYRSWVSASRVAWKVMCAHDPNIGLPLPARVHGLAEDAAPRPPLPTPPPVKAVTRRAPRRATATTRSPASAATTRTTTTYTTTKGNDHGGYQRTSSSRQASGGSRGGSDHLVFDTAERCDSGADD